MKMDKKAPGFYQILGVCVLKGVIGGLVASYYDPFGLGGSSGIRKENEFTLEIIFVLILFNLIGSGFGILSQKTNRGKWIGLWVSVVLFTLLCIFGPGAFYVFVGGQ